MIEKDNVFCPFCGVKVEEEKKICNECGNYINEGDNFCCKCGCPTVKLDEEDSSQQIDIVQEQNICPQCGNIIENEAKFCIMCGCQVIKQEDKSLLHTTEEKTVQKKKKTKKYAIITLSVIIAVVVIIVVIIQQNTLENKLMRQTWWETEINLSRYSGYLRDYNSAEYESITFCESGNVRIESFYSKEYTWGDDTPESWWNGRFTQLNSDNEYKWELLDNDKLFFRGVYYEWSKFKAEDTWFCDGNTLRIGRTTYTSERAPFSVNSSIPYWCDYCGEEGPFGDSCPECGKTKKTKPEW